MRAPVRGTGDVACGAVSCDAALRRMPRWSRPSRPMAACCAQAPKTVQLRFNETVTPAVVSLIDAAGKAREIARPRRRPIRRRSRCRRTCRRARRSSAIAWSRRTAIPSAGSLVFSIGMVTAAQSPQPATAGSFQRADLAGADRGLSRPVRRRRRRVLCRLDRQGPSGGKAILAGARASAFSARWSRSACRASICSTCRSAALRRWRPGKRIRDQPRASRS